MTRTKQCLSGLIILSGLLLSPIKSFARQVAEDIRFDLPADGQIRVENRYGGVSAEVWSNSSVSVSATLSSGTKPARFPILIDNRGKLLSVSVFRAPADSNLRVDLKIKLPASARVEIITTEGSIFLNGATTSAVLKSSSGNIQSILSDASVVNINARAASGAIVSTLEVQPDSSGHVLTARRESAARTLDAQTETGQITLSSEAVSQSDSPPKQPALIGVTARAAGTPQSDSSNNEVSEGDVIRVDSQLVTLNMSVIDRSTNRGLPGLHQSDFRLSENGEEQNISQFDSSSAPFDLFLLIDLSGSTKDKVKLIRAAATHFVDAARSADRIGVVVFAGESTVVSELTADRELLRQRVAAIDTAHGDTKLYDATDFVMNLALKSPTKSRRTAIVLMSDGLDGTIPGVSDQIGSKIPYADLLKNIQEFDGVLYTLWLNTRYEALNPRDTQPEAFDEGHDRLSQMADVGGGIFYEVNRLEDLAGAYEQVVADLGTVYSLSYRPTNKTRDGSWRAIRVSVVNRSNVAVRGKRGYYAN